MGSWNLKEIRYCDDHDYMNMHYAWKRAYVRSYHTFYQICVFTFLKEIGSDYVTKLVYNKDKDVVFAYRPGLFKDWQNVYETHHLEQTLPSPIGAFKTMGQNAKDGIFSIQCMNTKDVLTVYNDAKYWNHDLRDEFMAQTRTLWGDNSTGPYNGRVFKS